MKPLPNELAARLRALYKDADTWLEPLPNELASLAQRWHIELGELADNLSYNPVFWARDANKQACVLKLSPPSAEASSEMVALQHYNGDGACRLLRADASVCALLLERLQPGSSLQESWTPAGDEAQLAILLNLAQRLQREVPPGQGTPLKQWAHALNLPAAQIPEPLRGKARACLAELLPHSSHALLHGDLHHGNVLQSCPSPNCRASDGKGHCRVYRAIDPKGIVGPLGFEVGPYLLNPLPAGAHTLLALLPRRLKQCAAAFALPLQEVAAWGFIYAVLSACWSAAEGDDLWRRRALAVAQGLEPHL